MGMQMRTTPTMAMAVLRFQCLGRQLGPPVILHTLFLKSPPCPWPRSPPPPPIFFRFRLSLKPYFLTHSLSLGHTHTRGEHKVTFRWSSDLLRDCLTGICCSLSQDCSIHSHFEKDVQRNYYCIVLDYVLRDGFLIFFY